MLLSPFEIVLRNNKLVPLGAVGVFMLCYWHALGQDAATNSPPATNSVSKFYSEDDGWLDVSGFLDQKYGFIPLVIPITEPAVGYGAAGGVAFIDKPLGEALAGYGRPNITVVGGLGTENGTWGVFAGNVHHWFDEKLQTQIGLMYASVNLDFFGIGNDQQLDQHPLRYNLQPIG